MLYNSQIHSYATSYMFSPTTASIWHFFSKQRFFFGHPLLLHFRKNQYLDDCQHEFRLIIQFKRDNHEFRLIIYFKQGKSKIIYNIYSNSVNYILLCFLKILSVNMVLWWNSSSRFPELCVSFVNTYLSFLSLLLFCSIHQTKTSSLVNLFNACTDTFWLIDIINFDFRIKQWTTYD